MKKQRIKWFVLVAVGICILVGLIIARSQPTAMITTLEFEGVRSSLIVPNNKDGLEKVKKLCRDAIGEENIKPDSDYLEVSENKGEFVYYWKDNGGKCFITQACDGNRNGSEEIATRVIVGKTNAKAIMKITYNGEFLVIEAN